MYAFRNLFDKHPNIISGAVMAWVNLVIIAGWVRVDGKTVSALNLAIGATLALFVAAKTSNTAVLNELAADPPKIDGVSLAPVVPVVASRRRGQKGSTTVELVLGTALIADVVIGAVFGVVLAVVLVLVTLVVLGVLTLFVDF